MPDRDPPASGTVSCPASPVPRNWPGAPARHASSSRAASAAATRPPGSSISATSPGSPENPPEPGVPRPVWARNRHNVGAGAPKSSVSTAPKPYGSRVGRAVREPESCLRVREDGAASAARAGRLLSTARRRPAASTASALPHARLSIGPVLLGSKRYAPFPWAPRPPMKADISTLHKPDILILRRHAHLAPFPSARFCASLIPMPLLIRNADIVTVGCRFAADIYADKETITRIGE